ncbi:hypothetical protein [Lewinella sp. LCG006]|uniref:hypothetical protein n=1 Tax=Lewinella sp. LCG006 TaxID=3231911 RepID=UPI0034602480
MSTRSYAAWQTCLPGNLPTLFYAFDESENQTERVAAFRITDQVELNNLLLSKPERLRIHLGADPGFDFNTVPSSPAVEFYFEGLTKGGTNITLAFEWDPNPPFLEDGTYGPNSGPDEIPPDGAILFAKAWMETPYNMIGDAFEGYDSKNLVQRVKSYTFQEDETAALLSNLEKGLASNETHVCLYLGNSIPVSGHPFGFRPVIEIRPITNSRKTKTLNGDGSGSSFFDFSSPCPPVCSE